MRSECSSFTPISFCLSPCHDSERSRNVVGKELVLHLIESDIYLDVMFTSCSNGEQGGFAQERSAPGEYGAELNFSLQSDADIVDIRTPESYHLLSAGDAG